MKLSTTIEKIQNIPNLKNIGTINEFFESMRNNGFSGGHRNNNLEIIIAFSIFIGKYKFF